MSALAPLTGTLVAALQLIGTALLAALLVALLVRLLLPPQRKATTAGIADDTRGALRPPVATCLPPLAGLLALSVAGDGWVSAVSRHAALVFAILATGWLVLRLIGVARQRLAVRFPLSVADNLAARRVHTQLGVLARVAEVTVVALTVAAVLMTFPGVRHVGASLLASAGIAGLAIALAAKPLLSNIVAGVQIALSQPIRIDDVVVVEGHWGRIEEIATTHVVVNVWDQRRVILPLTWFLENPFENWTRRTAEMLGTVLVWADPGTPVEAVRGILEGLCRDDPDWDGRVALLQVVDSSERAMGLRALVSAADAGRLWNLRCRVREGLLTRIAAEFPDALPRVRADLGRSQDNLVAG